MSKQLRKTMAEELTKKLEKINSFVVFSYGKVTGEQNHIIRGKLRSQAIFVKAVKNTIAGIAIKQLFQKDMSALMKGPMAVAYGGEEPLNLIKALLEVSKKTKLLKVHGGYLEGSVLNEKQIEEVAKIPSKAALLSSVAASFNDPFQKIIVPVSGVLEALPNAFNAYIAKLEKTTN